MGITIVFAVVLVNTALAAVGIVAYLHLTGRIDAISATPVPVASRYCAPPDILNPAPIDGIVDTAGAWALERESLGIPVSDDEIAENRRMWKEFEAA